jgi:hypothetical protein
MLKLTEDEKMDEDEEYENEPESEASDPCETDLDVDSPEEAAEVLRTVALIYQDKARSLIKSERAQSAGRIWNAIAHILEKAADDIERKL